MKKTNCLVVDDEAIARDIIATYLSHVEDFNLIASCQNAQEAFEVLEKKEIDLIFLDIKMPGISGITLAKALKGDVKIIFTTAFRDYAVDGFDLQAVDYLLKPISPERFHQAIAKFKSESTNTTDSQKEASIMIRADRKTVKLQWSDILYVESFGDYLKIHLKDRSFITRETITSIEAKLPSEKFMRVHRSFLVAMNAITAFTKEQVEIGATSIPISRTYKKQVDSQLNQK